ncbi:MAG TPA: hypothetical protein PKY77_13830 [Phycisphaerae bacterium]|nr:hypothetical protein [Phycisphaerae bacterium]HRY70483.1 hypothetical protein [Phycisphaerae bacterium]HSA28212.1 hypothetical protein [Phycisphaerae bacterium]
MTELECCERAFDQVAAEVDMLRRRVVQLEAAGKLFNEDLKALLKNNPPTEWAVGVGSALDRWRVFLRELGVQYAE